jgi:hypothetical protein
MAGSIVAASSVAAGATPLSCAMPTGTGQFDVMVAAHATDWDTYAAMTAPAGWSLLGGYDVGSNSVHLKVWTKTAGVSEAGPYSFAQGSSSDGAVSIVSVRGVVEANALFAATYTSTTGSTRTAPSVTGANSGAVLLSGAMTDGSAAATTWTPPAGMTKQVDVQSVTFTTQGVASLLDPGTPTGTKDFVCTGTPVAPGGIQWSVVLLAPASAGLPRPPVVAPSAAVMRSVW